MERRSKTAEAVQPCGRRGRITPLVPIRLRSGPAVSGADVVLLANQKIGRELRVWNVLFVYMFTFLAAKRDMLPQLVGASVHRVVCGCWCSAIA